MSLHLGGFGETIDGAGTTQNLAALADPLLFTSGDTLRVPELENVAGMFAGIASGGTGICQLVAPSLREIGNYLVTPIMGNTDGDAEPSDPVRGADLRVTPLRLRHRENATVEFNSNTTVAQFQWLLMVFFDQIRPVPSGPVRTLRFTNTDTLTVDVWTNGALTAAEELPAGEYAVIGMRAISAGLVAARLVPRGSGWRPGCIGGDTDDYEGHPMFRYGGLGEWMRFVHDNIPSVDFLSVSADTDQDVFLDLVKVG